MASPTRLDVRVAAGAFVPMVALAALGGWMRHPAAVAAGVAAALLVGGLTLRRMRRVVHDATETAAGFAGGRFDLRMAVCGPEEVRELAEALNSVGTASAQRQDELTRALESAADQRDLFYSIFNASSDGLLAYDNARRLIAVNRHCGDLLGFPMQDLLHQDIGELKHSIEQRCDQPERYLPLLERHFEHPDQPHQDTLVLREPRRRVLRRYSCPVVNFRGMQGRVFTYTDVTAESDIDRMKSEFVSMASHELRTPLTSVHGALQLALSGSGHRLDAEDRELLDISLANTERLVRLVNDLLDLSKIEAGRMPFHLESIQPATIADEAARGMQGLAATHGATIRVVIDSGTGHFSGDRDHLVRVLTNLLSNALKYSPPGSAVTLRARPADEGVEFSVVDEGPGIPPDQLDRLFRPFSRLGVHERQTTGGTGLGLAISRAIVEQHGGRIWVERAQPCGSRFVFVLPSTGDAVAQPSASCRAVA